MATLSSSILLILLLCLVTLDGTVSSSSSSSTRSAGQDHNAAAAAVLDTELLQAAFSNNLDALASALSRGANPNAQQPGSGQTALMGAVLRGYTDIVKFLLSLPPQEEAAGGAIAAVDVSIPEKDGYTPAHGVGFQGRADCMRVLAAAGVNVVDDYHQDGFAPLHRACWGREQRHTDTIRVLRDEIGVDIVNLTAKNGKRCEDMTTNAATLELLRETKEKTKSGDEF